MATLRHKLHASAPEGEVKHLCDLTSAASKTQGLHGVGSDLLVRHDKFTKDLARVLTLPKFELASYVKPDEDRKALNKLLGYMRQNKKAAAIQLNKHGWKGYLVPGQDDTDDIACYYEHVGDYQLPQPIVPQPPGVIEPPKLISPVRSASMGALASNDPFAPKDPFAPSVSRDPFAPSSTKLETDDIRSHNGEFGRVKAGVVTAGQEQAEAADHYNKLVRVKEDQASSCIYHMKRYNNWVKSVLIQKSKKESGRSGLRVLDLACGKGGDLAKWRVHKDKIGRYDGIDIAKSSLNDLVERIKESPQWAKIDMRLVAADLSEDMDHDPSLEVWTKGTDGKGAWGKGTGSRPGDIYDVVSMQFALHYMGQSEEKLRNFLAFVSRRLRPNGVFVATTADARVLVELLMGHTELAQDKQSLDCDVKDDMGRCLLTIKFPADARRTILRPDAVSPNPCSPFGIRYKYVLREEGQEAVDAYEWMLPLPKLKRLAEEVGLQVTEALNFHHFYEKFRKDPTSAHLLKRMNVTDCRGTMNEAEWKVARIYMALIFTKVEDTRVDEDALSRVPKTPDHPPPPDVFTETVPRREAGQMGPFTPKSPEGPPPWWNTDINNTKMDVCNGNGTPVSPTGPPPPLEYGLAPSSPPGPAPPDDGDVGAIQDESSSDSDSDDDMGDIVARVKTKVGPDRYLGLGVGEKAAYIEAEKLAVRAEKTSRLE